jgi:hypothetical protein
MAARILLFAIPVAALLAGCASTGSGSSTDTSQAPPSANTQGTPKAQASSGPCTTKDCIITDAKNTLVSGVAKNESVMTKLACRNSTVKNPHPGVWTVRCTADYSNGMIAKGVANVLLKTSQLPWSPTDIVSYGDES